MGKLQVDPKIHRDTKRTQSSQNSLIKQKQLEDLTCPNFKTHYKTTVINTGLRLDMYINQIEVRSK